MQLASDGTGARNPLFGYPGTVLSFFTRSPSTVSQRLTRLPRLLEDLWPNPVQYYVLGIGPAEPERSGKVAHRGPPRLYRFQSG